MAARSKSRKTARKAAGRKAAKPARKASPRPRKRPVADDLKARLKRRTDELTKAREQQAATAEVLQIISSSSGDLKPVFESMLAKAMHLCEAQCGFIYQIEQGAMRAVAEIGVPAAFAEYRRHHLHTGGATTPADVMRATQKPAHVHDARDSDAYRQGNPNAVAGVELGGARTVLYVPMAKNDDIVGVINLYRQEVKPFRDEQIALVEHFASQAVVAIENARLFNETREALERQTATAGILRVIASSPSNLKPVFEAIAARSVELVGGHSAAVSMFVGDRAELGALTPVSPEADAALAALYPRRLKDYPLFALVRDGEVAQVSDMETDPRVPMQARGSARSRGFRSMALVPMNGDEGPIGVISVTRKQPGTFAAHHIQLMQTFADQAVIAIRNTRLFEEVQARTAELTESLQQQTATADVLRVIASSPTDVMPVLDAIVKSACQLCEANDAYVALRDDDDLVFQTHHGSIPVAWKRRPLNRQWPAGRAVIDGKPVHLRDVMAGEGDEFPDGRDIARRDGAHSILTVPLMREGKSVGVIILRRIEIQAFTEKQTALLETFADQAVVAIENARLFEEVQARTRELSEALTHQTGSANILNVIASSPTDVAPVLKAIVESACELCGAYDAVALLKDGDYLVFGAHHGPIPIETERLLISRNWTPGLAVIERKPVHVHDLLSSEGDQVPEAQRRAREFGYRTILSVPMLRDKESIGVLALRRAEADPFSDKQIALLQTFADQAVIAIGNVRLFEEVQARTAELSESLEQQTATSEVLQVISSSQGELKQVFQAMLESATRVCGASFGFLNLWDGAVFSRAAEYNTPAAFVAARGALPIRPHPQSGLAAIVRTHKPAHVLDVRAEVPYREGDSGVRAIADLAGARTVLVAPMVRDDELIGSITIYRQEVRPFTDKQIALIENFSRQAVIAIENARLLNALRDRTGELTESLQQQTATSEVLQVISSSPGDLAPVFKKMLENAVRICGAGFGVMLLIEDGLVRPAARYNANPAFAAARGDGAYPPPPRSMLAQAIETKQVAHIEDLRTNPAYLEGAQSAVDLVELGGARTLAAVPMLRDNEVIGVISIYRQELRLFTDKQIELVRNFAKQAVIAIENARLLKELRDRTDELSRSLDDLRTAQDRLIQTEKLASLGQLTAGIAHEIKNPLNFVNNFSALSTELIDELDEELARVSIEDKRRAEIGELTGMLKSNLEKVVQHGKRADAIVKNMLLHSRAGSGEQRSADVNALVEESLNLAYHGARAEKTGFNITLARDFDPEAGAADVFPQEITRVLLNLISNGFYAATKRKETADGSFEPTVSAATKNLGNSIEIRIRDNGAGIPPDVREKIFNPFFTTKPAGEGTGLGLSMSHDIIVKQHGGTIDVDTKVGSFTEFIVTLRRKGAAQAAS
jgi:GAF domain-containing protein